MATVASLKKEYLGRRFENGGGYTTREYDSFQRKYTNYLRSMCQNNNWTLVWASKGHYEFSAMIKDSNGKFCYFSISDVRAWQDQWFNHILIRGAKHEKDYTGMTNEYTSLPDAESHIKWIFRRLEEKSQEVSV